MTSSTNPDPNTPLIEGVRYRFEKYADQMAYDLRDDLVMVFEDYDVHPDTENDDQLLVEGKTYRLTVQLIEVPAE